MDDIKAFNTIFYVFKKTKFQHILISNLFDSKGSPWFTTSQLQKHNSLDFLLKDSAVKYTNQFMIIHLICFYSYEKEIRTLK